jgi:hypothetical protein
LALRWIPLLLIALSARAQDCAVCHAGIAQSYRKTPMALSSGPVGTGLIAESFGKAAFKHERTGYSYRAFPDASKLLFSFGKPGAPEHKRELSYFIGSGAGARSYSLQSGGFHSQVAPPANRVSAVKRLIGSVE